MSKEAEPLEDVLRRIHETLVSSEARPTTPQQLSDEESKLRRRNWIDKWLPMQPTHPQVEAMQNAVYQFCADYSRCPTKGRRLVIYGENGTGKSRAAKALYSWANAVALQLPLVPAEEGARLANARFYNFPTLLKELPKNWDIITELGERPNAPSLLVLDDIGAEHDPSKFGAEQLYLLLERRLTQWTLLTTNAGPGDWERKWDRRVSSRLFRNCEHVAMDKAPDFSTL